MASMQAPGSSKADKFKAANPLGPMADPFAGLDEEQKDYHKALSESVNARLEKTMEEIKDQHARGVAARDDPDRAPTGEPYKQIQRQALLRARQIQQREEQAELERRRILQAQRDAQRRREEEEEEEDDVDSDEEWLDELENDPALEAIREKRIAEMRQKQMDKAQNLALGHGYYRTITQDEFLPECTGSSKWVVVHFYHDEFQKCKVMDHHLKIVAEQHVECKFLRINAEKAPFFCAKLKIKTLPTVLVFQDGETKDRLTGFEGIASDGAENWPTSKLQKWLSQSGAIEYDPPSEEMEEEMRQLGLTPKSSIWTGGVREYDDE